MSDEHVEIRNLRHLSGRDLPNSVSFGDYSRDHIVTMTRDKFVTLGEPAYIVVIVRAETFAESTQ